MNLKTFRQKSETIKTQILINTIPTFVGTSTRKHIGSSHLKLVCQNSSSPYKQ